MKSAMTSAICLACGGVAAVGSRRIIKTQSCDGVSILWKEIERELEKKGEALDLDNLISSQQEAYMCRKCFYAYEKTTRSKEGNQLLMFSCSC